MPKRLAPAMTLRPRLLAQTEMPLDLGQPAQQRRHQLILMRLLIAGELGRENMQRADRHLDLRKSRVLGAAERSPPADLGHKCDERFLNTVKAIADNSLRDPRFWDLRKDR